MTNPTTPLPVQEPAGAVEAKPSYMTWNLHPRTAELVHRFSYALAGKLAAAEKKYGFSDGWADPDWMDECREKLLDHIDKGDPRDVAAYCAFLWHHGASTAPSKPSMKTIADLAAVFDEGVRQGAALASIPPATQAKSEAVAQWTLTAPDGRTFVGDSPIRCAQAELNTRVPADVQVARIWAAVDEDSQEAVERQPLTGWISVEDERKPLGRTPILVAVQWMNHYEHEDGTPAQQCGCDVTEGEYVPQHGDRDGYFDSFAAPYDHDGWGITHWQPLPEPPGIGPATQEKTE